MSSYFEKTSLQSYNTNQKDYLACSYRVVNRTIEKMKSSKEDPKLLFYQIIDDLGQQRQRIAFTYGTENAVAFGARRDRHFIPSATSLLGRYQKYGNQIIEQVHGYFQEALKENHPWPKEPFQKTFRPYLGHTPSCEMFFINSENQDTIFPTQRIADFQQMYQLCGLELPLYFIRDGEIRFQRLEALKELTSNRKAMERLAQQSPNDYQKLKNTLFIAITHWQEEISTYPNWVLVNYHLETKGQKRLISQYLLQCDKDPSNECNLDCFDIKVIHQDPLTINLTLDKIADVFKQALSWRKQIDLREDLKRTVALLLYEWSRAAPFARGSAATGEWLEQAIYEYHDFVCEHHPEKPVNLEALALTLPEFIDAYDSIVTVIDPYDPNESPLPDWNEAWSEEEIETSLP